MCVHGLHPLQVQLVLLCSLHPPLPVSLAEKSWLKILFDDLLREKNIVC
jgi:hypothetical protein